MQPVTGINNLPRIIENEQPKLKAKGDFQKPQADKIEISNTSKAFQKLDNFLNLGKPDRLDTSDLNPEEKKEFLKMLSSLLQKGVVGYEVLEVNGKPEKHYIVNEIGDRRIYGAKLYKKRGYLDRKD